MIKLVLPLMALSGFTPVWAANGDLAEAWSIVYNNGTNNYDEGADIYVGAAGSVYVTGRSYNGGNYDFATVKYNNTGVQQWASRYNGGSGDEAVAVTVDGSGNVYVTGRSYTSGQYDYTTIKYNSSGVQTWVVTYDNAGNDDAPVAIAVDSSGNVFVTGTSGNGTDTDYATVKYNSSGSQVWAERHDSGGNDEAVSLGLDSNGNAYVTGSTESSSTDITTIRYASSDGNADWSTTYNTGNNDFAAALKVDGNGSTGKVHVTGRQFGTLLYDIITLEYDTASGTQQWGALYQTSSHDMAAAITTDSSGNVYVTGKSGNPFSYDYITLKYSSDGTQIWSTPYDSGNNDEAVDIRVDADGNVFVTGLSHNGTNNDYVTVRYDSSGAQSSVVTTNNGNDNTPAAMALGGDSSVYVTGISFNGSNNDFLTTKYVISRPDLTVTTVSGPATVANENVVNVNNTIQNILDAATGKNADAGSFDVGLYLAPQVSGAPDLGSLVFLTSRNISSLAKGASDAAVTSVTIPSTGTAPSGNYYFVAIADTGDAVEEKDETNNTGVSTVIAVVDAPDLVATSVSGQAGAQAGGTISVNYTINNPRTAAAGGFDASFVLSSDTVIGNGDDIVLTGVANIAGISGGGSVSDSASVTIPGPTAEDIYYFGMIVDSGGTVFETDETNNTVVSTATVDVTGAADLLLTEISGPYGAVQGETVSVTNTVQNTGGAQSIPFSVGIYLSTDSTITTADILIGTRTINSIGAGASDSDNTSVQIPSTIALGGYYLGAIVDYTNVIIEDNEANNTLDGWALSVDTGFDGGDDSDGAVTIAGTVNLTTGNAGADSDDNGSQPDAYATLLTANASKGETSLTVTSTAGFVTGDEVLIVQVIHDTNHGQYAFARNITVVNGTTLSLDNPLFNSYFATGTTAKGTTNTVQVVRVPHYSTLNVPNGTTLTASAFSSTTRLGGILVFRATTVTINGTLSANGLGLPGGAPINNSGGEQGWSYTGQGSQSINANAGGGGGGVTVNNFSTGGGGGGYGTAGAQGIAGNGAVSGGLGGTVYGDAQLNRIYPGSGGGAGRHATGGTGGKGGGVLYVGTDSLTVSGTGVVSANGAVGETVTPAGRGGGGGGSGGSVYLSAASRTITGSVIVNGGIGGDGFGSGTANNGGVGGVGRIYQPNVATDLTITDVSGPTSAARGNTISVSTTVANVQAVAAGAFKVGIYLSTDATITTSDTKIGECTLTGLAGNTSSALTTGSSPECTSAVIPSGLYAGGGPQTYYLGAIADYQNVVTELTEINNAKVQTSSGSPQSTSVSVLTGTLNASDNSGGGILGLIELILGLGGLGIALRRRRFHSIYNY